MTQTFVEGKRVPLTTLVVDSHVAVSNKTANKDGYNAQIIGIGAKKSATKPVKSFLKKLGIEVTPKYLREVSTEESIPANTTINLTEILTPGLTVSVTSMSKGKGFAGVMKRHGFHGSQRTHGQSDRKRAPGSIARGTTPGRIVPGKKMAGRMGSDNICIKNLAIHSYNPETNLLTLTGPIPGSKGTLARITINKKA